MKEKKRMLFIINPNSGTTKISDLNERIGGLIDYTCFEVDAEITRYKNHASELAKQAVIDGYHYIIAVGGDGTVNEIANELTNTQTVLGIIPVGSGNGLARHLKIPLDIDSAIELLNRRTEKFIDSIEINKKFFFNIAGIGFDAFIASEFGKNGLRGFSGYRNLIFKNYFKYQPTNYEIYTHDQNLSMNALMVCLANGKQWGNGIVISPKSSVSDGVLDICIVSKVPRLFLPSFILKLLNNKLESSKYIRRLKTKKAVIIQKSNLVHLDGEPHELGNKLKIEVHPTSLRVLVNK